MSAALQKCVFEHLCHCNTKGGITGQGFINPSVGMALNILKKDWQDPPTNPSLGMIIEKILKDTFLQHATHICLLFTCHATANVSCLFSSQ